MEGFNKIGCHITQTTLDIYDGIKASLKSKVSKYSEKAGKTIDFTKISTFTALPRLLCVTFLRFDWKNKEQIQAKILKAS